MASITVTDLTFAYEGTYDNIFTHTSFRIDTDWKLGFIGRNGRGKTTFLRLLLGTYPYQGSIQAPVRFDYFPYEVPDPQETTLNCVREVVAPFAAWEAEMAACLERNGPGDLDRYGELQLRYAQQGGYEIDGLVRREMGKLGLGEEPLGRPFATLSNGERTKALLAALFLKRNNFLLIDEPTNHLDLAGRDLLAEYLRGKRGFILVSHDRAFLDRCVDHVLSINRNSIEVQRGNYTTWQQNKDLQDRYELERNEQLKGEIGRLAEAVTRTAAWSDRIEAGKIGGHAGDRGHIGHMAAKMMKRSKAIERRQTEALEEKRALLKNVEQAGALSLHAQEHHSRRYVELREFSVLREGRPVFPELTLTVERGDRVAVMGQNGSGKSTLLRYLLGERLESRGYCRVAPGLRISYVPQDTGFLRGGLLDLARERGVDYTFLLTLLRYLDFPREQFEKPMERYSAGQRKKVLLAASLADPGALLIWDEPLNYVDVLSRVQVENMLLQDRPTMLFTEHDRAFTDRVATKRLQL